jgi:hypothetical protein
VALALVALAACTSPLSGRASASASPSATVSVSPQKPGKLHAEVAMPPDFPRDVPVYPGARLTAAAGFPSSATTAWGMEWETLDSVAKVQAFYQQKMNQGDWKMAVSGSTKTAFAATFSRKSDSRVGGTLAANYNGGVTRIDLSLVTAA